MDLRIGHAAPDSKRGRNLPRLLGSVKKPAGTSGWPALERHHLSQGLIMSEGPSYLQRLRRLFPRLVQPAARRAEAEHGDQTRPSQRPY